MVKKAQKFFTLLTLWLLLLIVWSYFLNGNYVIAIDHGHYPIMSYIVLGCMLILSLLILSVLRMKINLISTRSLKIILIIYSCIAIFSTIVLAIDTIASNKYLETIYSIEEISIDSLNNKIDLRMSMIIYFYHDECNYCKIIEEPLNTFVEEKQRLIITKFNTKKYQNTQNMEEVSKLLDHLDINGVPALVYIRDGQVEEIKYFEEIATLIGYELDKKVENNIFEIKSSK